MSLQWMGYQFLDLVFQLSCHLSCSFVVCLLQFTRGTVFEWVLLLMLQLRGYPMLKSASYGDGNLMHFSSISERLVSTLKAVS